MKFNTAGYDAGPDDEFLTYFAAALAAHGIDARFNVDDTPDIVIVTPGVDGIDDALSAFPIFIMNDMSHEGADAVALDVEDFLYGAPVPDDQFVVDNTWSAVTELPDGRTLTVDATGEHDSGGDYYVPDVAPAEHAATVSESRFDVDAALA